MLQPVAREPIQLFFMIVSLICDFSFHFTPNVFKVTHSESSNERPGAHFKFQLRGGALIGRLIEEVGGGGGSLLS